MVSDDDDRVISCCCWPRSNGRWVAFRSPKTLVPILRIELSSERKGEGRECVMRLFGRGRRFAAAVPGEGEIRWNWGWDDDKPDAEPRPPVVAAEPREARWPGNGAGGG